MPICWKTQKHTFYQFLHACQNNLNMQRAATVQIDFSYFIFSQVSNSNWNAKFSLLQLLFDNVFRVGSSVESKLNCRRIFLVMNWTIFYVRSFEAKSRAFKFDYQKMNMFKFVGCSKNDVRFRLMFDKMVFDPKLNFSRRWF